MPVTEFKPYYLQIADRIAAEISAGELEVGAKLPTMQELAAFEGVSHQTAVRAVEILRANQYVTTSRDGSFVLPRRLVTGPQVLAGVRGPVRTAVRSAEIAAAPRYIAEIMGLLEVKAGQWNVIRREQLTDDPGGTPLRLEVEWFPPELAAAVPALLGPGPLEVGDAVTAIAEAGWPPVRWRHAMESRPVRDDGREGPLLGVPAGYVVAAHTWWWMAAASWPGRGEPLMLAYWEYILPQGRVTEAEGTAA